MDWHIKEREYSRTFRDASGNDWGYISARKLSARYPNGGYRIVADLKKKENSSGENFLTGGTQRACLYPYKRKHTRSEKTVGYIDVSDPDHPDSFVRIRTGNLFKGVILPAAILLLLCGLFLLGWYVNGAMEALYGAESPVVADNGVRMFAVIATAVLHVYYLAFTRRKPDL